MNTYQLLSTALAVLLYLPLGRRLLKGTAKQNIATWGLWGILDLVVAISIYMQHGNWFLPGAYVFGAFAMVLCMLRAKTFSWGKVETLSCFLVIACLIGWVVSGPRMATILSTSGVLLASIPQIKDAFNTPEDVPLASYVGYVAANGLATAGGTAWTVEERLYGFSCTLLCGAIVLIACRKYYDGIPESV